MDLWNRGELSGEKRPQSRTQNAMGCVKKSQREAKGQIAAPRTAFSPKEESGFLLRVLLDVGHAVAIEAHEHGLRRRLAVNPVLNVIAFVVAFADFVVGLANRSYHL